MSTPIEDDLYYIGNMLDIAERESMLIKVVLTYTRKPSTWRDVVLDL